MRIIVVTGGARSGKSTYALRRAWALGGDSVTVIVTAAPTDEEMARRIARHRADRPSSWTTLEAQTKAASALARAETAVVLLDCLTLLVANRLIEAEPRGEAEAIAAAADEVETLLRSADGRLGTLVVVTNEVGFGVVPASALGRWFRDALGLANQRLASQADEVVLLLSGIPIPLKA